ncbi:Lin0512 family protein [Thalassococcus sp. CAU 1522]|uniref:Lin0512 family protein n=1 Tax=Thalassococcus arenae TaxID=2851652 RepID=A0ABS6NC43_9RHOB|nr:Lin0512 family protein [Thalassococcus arenae]MBV2361134.1 Lin0512 family protein [Thalassococcus arenae]
MSLQRLIIEMGMGVDLHGQDHTKAARRAVEDALRHSSMPVLRAIDGLKAQARVKVTIGVPRPDAVDREAVACVLPHDGVEIVVVEGGLSVADAAYGGAHVIASAAVELFLPRQHGWRLGRSEV